MMQNISKPISNHETTKLYFMNTASKEYSSHDDFLFEKMQNKKLLKLISRIFDKFKSHMWLFKRLTGFLLIATKKLREKDEEEEGA